MSNSLNELSAIYLSNIAEQDDNTPEQVKTRVMQIVKAIRYKARKEGGNIVKAFNDYMGGQSGIGAAERQMIKQRLGLSEDYETQKTAEVLGALKKKKKDFKKRYGKMGPDVMLQVAKDTVKRKGDTSKSDDRYAYEEIEAAVEYFYEQGINEEGLDLIVEEIGLEEFVYFVTDSAIELNEERAARKMNVRTLKATKKRAAEIKADKSDIVPRATPKDTFARVRAIRSGKKPKLASPSSKPVAKKVEKAVKKVKTTQPAKKPSKEGLRSRATEFVKKGVERHKAAVKKNPFASGVESGVRDTVDFVVKAKRAIAPRKEVKEGKIADKLKQVVADMKDADRKAGLLPGGKDVVDLDVERQRRRKKVEERFSNWRNEITLMEVPDDVPETDDEMQVRIKKKKVNNAKLIKINPNIGEEIKKLGGELLEMTEEEVQLEAKVDVGKSAAEKAKTRNLRNTPPGADKDTDLKTFITRKPGESLDSARRRVRQGQHAARRGVKEDKAFNNVVSKIRESATNPQKFSMKKFARGLEKEYGKGSVISKYTEKPKPQPQKKRGPVKDTRTDAQKKRDQEQANIDAQYGRTAVDKKGSLGT